jgi:molecular chaperone HscB
MQDYFSLFSLPRHFSIDESALIDAYHSAAAKVHPDRVANADDATKHRAARDSAEINDAYQTLKNPVARARYLLTLNHIDPDDAKLSMDFLEEELEQRETAESLLDAHDEDALDDLTDSLRRQLKERQKQISELLDNAAPDANALERARAIALEMQFLQKFANDIDERRE